MEMLFTALLILPVLYVLCENELPNLSTFLMLLSSTFASLCDCFRKLRLSAWQIVISFGNVFVHYEYSLDQIYKGEHSQHK